eukprot:CAMPEP_0198438424 /NCGR_PEP_ID=MMETSP1452-20131203/50928_1 /TAXON_ID=1181717 /ORGANISM="Synchroma pusillum, Strain CCMP3072" /LENGTH=66 /DNA_ID=CAMNT_0044159007 /DNA_START=36 /DNA_END=233 /DNA_ORIENTATION=-
MEKENRKCRDEQKKAWQKQVQELVAFVKKRDPRVKEAEKLAKERKEAEHKRREEALKRERRQRREA